MTTNNPLTWPPYRITAIEIGDDRTGFIGRAAAVRIGGVEVIVMCRNADELALIGDELTSGEFDIERIYKATLIRTEGVEVDIPTPVPGETVKPVVPEQPATPSVVPTETLKREDGVPVAQYIGETDAEADARIASEQEAFEAAGLPDPVTTDDDDEL